MSDLTDGPTHMQAQTGLRVGGETAAAGRRFMVGTGRAGLYNAVAARGARL